MRRGSVLVALGLALALPARTAAADEKQQCMTASDQGQSLRDDGKYRRAREAFTTCSRDMCPGIVRRDCLKWLADLEASSPSVVVGAKDDKGNDLVDVNVLVDGTPLESKLDGKPTLVDPGEHVFRFEAAGYPPVEQRIVVHAGEKSRLIAVQFGNVPAAPAAGAQPAVPGAAPEQPSGRSPQGPRTSAWVLGGIAVVAFATEAYFGFSGLGDRSTLEQGCGKTATCTQSSVDSIRTKFTVADIALGVGVVSTAISAYLFLAPQSASVPAPGSAVDVTPVPGGAAMTVGGRF